MGAPLILSGHQSARPAGTYSAGIGDILKMLDAKVSTQVILSYIEASPIPYNPDAAELIALKEHGASVEILMALLHHGDGLRLQLAQAPSPTVPEAAPAAAPDVPEESEAAVPEPTEEPPGEYPLLIGQPTIFWRGGEWQVWRHGTWRPFHAHDDEDANVPERGAGGARHDQANGDGRNHERPHNGARGAGQRHGGIGKPNTGIGQPNMALGRTTIGIGKPNMAIGRPTIGIGEPNMTMGQPTIGIGQPTIGIGRPNLGVGQPTFGTGSDSGRFGGSR